MRIVLGLRPSRLYNSACGHCVQREQEEVAKTHERHYLRGFPVDCSITHPCLVFDFVKSTLPHVHMGRDE